jgi:signal peptide peptidase SppA
MIPTFTGMPLAMSEAAYAELKKVLERQAEAAVDQQAKMTAGISPRSGGYQTVGRVALINVSGILLPHASALAEFFGYIGCDSIGAQVDAALADKGINKIALRVDSPGGSVFGVQELADKLRVAREQKPIVAVADGEAASGAYWVISQASEVFCSPSSMVGSIGVIVDHVSYADAEKKLGIQTTLIRSTDQKQASHPSFPLSAEAKADIQAIVDSFYAKFLAGVGKGRGVTAAKVVSDFGGGRMLVAEDARRVGMVDGIASLETVLKRIVGGGSSFAIAAEQRALEVGAEGFKQKAAMKVRSLDVEKSAADAKKKLAELEAQKGKPVYPVDRRSAVERARQVSR